MLQSILFYILAVFLVGSSIVMITRTNPIATALWLVVAFVALAGLFALQGAGILAAIQILVYAGGILVLIVFVIMLLNLRKRDLTLLSPHMLPLTAALVAAILFVLLTGWVVLSSGGSMSGDAKVNLVTIHTIASTLFTEYLFPFEILSLLLMSAITGALVLTRRRL